MKLPSTVMPTLIVLEIHPFKHVYRVPNLRAGMQQNVKLHACYWSLEWSLTTNNKQACSLMFFCIPTLRRVWYFHTVSEVRVCQIYIIVCFGYNRMAL